MKPGCEVKISILNALHFLAASWECLESRQFQIVSRRQALVRTHQLLFLKSPDNCESAWKNVQDTVNVSCNLEDLVAADDNTATCGLQSVEDLREEQKYHDSDEEEDYDATTTAISKPTCPEAVEQLQTLRNFVTSTSDVPSDVMKSLWNLEG
ncbi:hypothetical protein PR048_018378 [Dryococelus australis]|uniref:Uncharacterized protein n=1 Tax=Dryococelus australis TaxID=614101 RepID=A0ABQ9HC41_9NEOP|nr:hypothetical protein PR048_018378 [Dryococelus australis]